MSSVFVDIIQRLHQQQNSPEYKQNINKKSSITESCFMSTETEMSIEYIQQI
jgi:hypothetical protein